VLRSLRRRGLYLRLIGLVVLLAAMYIAFMTSKYYLLFITNLVFFAAIVLAWNIIGGYAGQLDLGTTGYMGVGAIVSSILSNNIGLHPLISIILGGLSSALLAGAIGFPMFRFGVREVWYALSTAAIVVILNNAVRLLIGPYEYYLRVRPIKTYDELYLATSIALVLVFLLNHAVNNSRLGYYLKAIREDELAAEAIGVDTRRYKLLALMIYAFIVGSLGYLYVVMIGYFYTYRFFDTGISVSIAILGIIGGLGSIEGCLVSAFLLRGVGEYLRTSLAHIIPGLHLLLYGAVLITLGVVEPEGIPGIARRFTTLLKTTKRPMGGVK